jgi:hypothetical protein
MMRLGAFSPAMPGEVAALMRALDAAEGRAFAAEGRLALHARHCICRSAAVAADEMCGAIGLRTAA